MKFLVALFAGAAVASSIGSPVVKRASLVERDAATVSSAIASISDATEKLDTAVKGFNGAGQVSSLQSASSDLIKTLGSATSSVEGSGDLSQSDALTLPQPVQDLSKLVKTATNDVISKKQTFVSAGVASVVYSQLVEIRDGAKKFSDALTSKVPESLQTIAGNLASPINENLNNAVNEYQDVKNSGSSSSASGSASASATETTSAAETASATETASASASKSSAAGGSYPTGSTPTTSNSGSSTTAPGAVSPSSNGTGSYTTGSTPPIATGAAAHVAAGYGAAAVAALAVVAAF